MNSLLHYLSIFHRANIKIWEYLLVNNMQIYNMNETANKMKHIYQMESLNKQFH